MAAAGFGRASTRAGGLYARWPVVAYGTSAGAPPRGQSYSLPGESRRGFDEMYAATSNACCGVSVFPAPSGMLCQMNDAAFPSRVIDAPTLNDFGPQTAGAGGCNAGLPSPDAWWQATQNFVYTPSPRVASPSMPAGIAANPAAPGSRCPSPTGTPRDSHAMYASMSCISRLSRGSLLPPRLRVKQ